MDFNLGTYNFYSNIQKLQTNSSFVYIINSALLINWTFLWSRPLLNLCLIEILVPFWCKWISNNRIVIINENFFPSVNIINGNNSSDPSISWMHGKIKSGSQFQKVMINFMAQCCSKLCYIPIAFRDIYLKFVTIFFKA